jgi:hypothetical protein
MRDLQIRKFRGVVLEVDERSLPADQVHAEGGRASDRRRTRRCQGKSLSLRPWKSMASPADASTSDAVFRFHLHLRCRPPLPSPSPTPSSSTGRNQLETKWPTTKHVHELYTNSRCGAPRRLLVYNTCIHRPSWGL